MLVYILKVITGLRVIGLAASPLGTLKAGETSYILNLKNSRGKRKTAGKKRCFKGELIKKIEYYIREHVAQ